MNLRSEGSGRDLFASALALARGRIRVSDVLFIRSIVNSIIIIIIINIIHIITIISITFITIIIIISSSSSYYY